MERLAKALNLVSILAPRQWVLPKALIGLLAQRALPQSRAAIPGTAGHTLPLEREAAIWRVRSNALLGNRTALVMLSTARSA
jgi:hypothetical protein